MEFPFQGVLNAEMELVVGDLELLLNEIGQFGLILEGFLSLFLKYRDRSPFISLDIRQEYLKFLCRTQGVKGKRF